MDWWRVGVASNPCSDHGSPTSELMSKRDYYEVLGASRDADGDALKKAYRRLAMKLHPDRNPDDDGAAEEKFKEAKEAYDILSDPQKRGAYDQFGHAAVEQSAGGAGFSGGFRDIFDEVFGDIFSGRGEVNGPIVVQICAIDSTSPSNRRCSANPSRSAYRPRSTAPSVPGTAPLPAPRRLPAPPVTGRDRCVHNRGFSLSSRPVPDAAAMGG